jgi:hypothetical protein
MNVNIMEAVFKQLITCIFLFCLLFRIMLRGKSTITYTVSPPIIRDTATQPFSLLLIGYIKSPVLSLKYSVADPDPGLNKWPNINFFGVCKSYKYSRNLCCIR